MRARQRNPGAKRLRRLGKRAVYSLLPLALVLITAEGLLRVTGYRGHPDREVSWCAEHQGHELAPFVDMPLDRETRAYVATALAAQPRPFPVRKRGHERRIFVLGGSAAHGYGFSRNGSFAGRMEQLSTEMFPGLDVQVINMGVVAASSQQVLQLAKRILVDQQPDALVVYSGNNELLELWDWRQYLTPSQHRTYVAGLRWNLRLSDLRTFLWLRERLRGGDLPSWGRTGYTRDQMLPWSERAPLTDRDRAYARETFRHNIGRLVELARADGVPVVLSSVTASWAIKPGRFDLPGYEEPEELPALLERIEETLRDGQGSAGLAEAEGLCAEAFDLWPVAHTHWHCGDLMRHAGHGEAALDHFMEAVRLDENPNRVPPYINDEIRELARLPGVTFVDGEAEVAAMTSDGIPGFEEVFDHCHPSLGAHWVLGAAMTEALADLWPGDVDPAAPDPRVVAARRVAALEDPRFDPDRVETYLGMSWVDGAWRYGGNPESAGLLRWSEARGETARRPGDPDAWNHQGVVAFHYHRADCGSERACLQHAVDAFRKALSLDPDHCSARSNLGGVLVQTGRTAKGIDHLEEAARCSPDAALDARIARVRAWPGSDR